MEATQNEMPENAIPPIRFVSRAHTLIMALLCLMPPLFLSYRLPTLHELTDNKWLVVVFLSCCGIALSGVAWAFSADSRFPKITPLKIALLAGLALFLLIRLAAAIGSPVPLSSIRATIPTFSLAALFLTLVVLPPAQDQIRKWTLLIILTGALVGALALLQHSGLDPLRALVRYRETVRYRTGVFVALGNPEYLGGYLAPIGVLALAMALGEASRGIRRIALIAAAVTAVPAFLSGSRGAFLGMIIAGALVAVAWLATSPALSRRARRIVFGAAGLAFILVALAVAFSPRTNRIGSMRARMGEIARPYSESLRDRIVFNLVGLEMVAQHPLLGVGPGRFGVEFYPSLLALAERDRGVAFEVIARDFNGAVAEHAHNDWLQIWAETGTLGFAAWLWFIVVWLLTIARALFRATLFSATRFLMLANAAACVALLINGVFNFPLHEPVRATLFWLCAAWSASLAFSDAPAA